MQKVSRRAALAILAGASLPQPGFARIPPPEPFSFSDLSLRARQLAQDPFDAQVPPLPDRLAQLSYDETREIRFRRDHRLLGEAGGSFRLELFHRGPLAQRPVAIHILRDEMAEAVPYESELFDYGRTQISNHLPDDLGFAGLRLLYLLNRSDVMDELGVFLGASYFRFLSRHQRYGLSARTLAINSGMNPEEFPFFRSFYVEEPKEAANSITLYALLDSPSIAGACRFTFAPGTATAVDVDLDLYPRVRIERLGLAPLTSMFYAGEADRRVEDDFRAEVHDSDGLLVHMRSGEWLWRPLRNPQQAMLSSFGGDDLRGFGLIQRDRLWSRYSDIEAAYEARPSYWVEPKGDWGKGRLELVELNAHEETVDNIVAFWSPAEPLQPLNRSRFSYRMTSLPEVSHLQPGGQTAHTIVMSLPDEGVLARRRYVIDFAAGDLAYWAKDPGRVEAVVSGHFVRIDGASVRANPHVQGLRAVVDVAVERGQQGELRAFLRAGPHALTETWTTLWAP
jgi:glucans biosynthesis protein